MILGLDLETTGLDLATAKICQLGLAHIDLTAAGLTVSHTESHLINPGCPVPAEASTIHGLTDETLRHAPTFVVTWPALPAHRASWALLGYNLRTYDLPLLTRECADAGLLLRPVPVIDVYDLVCWHLRSMRKRTLGEICGVLGIKLVRAHDAVSDIEAAVKVLRWMQDRDLVLKVSGVGGLDQLLIHCARVAVLLDAEWDRWSYYLYDRGDGLRCGFGKEIGTRVDRLPAGWLRWALGEMRTAPEQVRSVWRGELERRKLGSTVG